MVKTFSAKTSININASVDRVWDALTNPEIIKKYMHGTNTQTDWVTGHPITWSGKWQGQAYEDRGEILTCEPKKNLKVSHWSPLSGKEDKPENYHVISYELSPMGQQTVLTVIHENSPSQEDADSMIKNGWQPTIETIKRLLEDK